MANLKKRPRTHIIADLSVNFLERFFLNDGHAVNRPTSGNDYGFDLSVQTFSSDHQIENGWISIQLKATDKIKTIKNGQLLSLSIRLADIHHWTKEVDPVLLVIYDAIKEEAFWLDVKKYFKDRRRIKSEKNLKSLTFLIPSINKISAETVKRIVNDKRDQYVKNSKMLGL